MGSSASSSSAYRKSIRIACTGFCKPRPRIPSVPADPSPTGMVESGMACPLCRRPTTWEDNPWRPFCSERCQLIDLGTWAAEQYRVPGPNLLMELPTEARQDPDSDAG